MAEMSATGRTVVIYHYPCQDGVFGALAAHLHATHVAKTEVVWMPLTVYEAPAKRIERARATLLPSDDVHLVDFSGGVEFVLACCAAARSVRLVDHHKTAEEDLAALAARGALPDNFTSLVDMKRSGATLAWAAWECGAAGGAADLACGGDVAKRAALERAFALTEDNDLWRHALPDSRAFAAGFAELKIELDANKNPGVFAGLLGLDVDAVVAAGAASIARDAAIIAAEVGAATAITMPPPAGSDLPALSCLGLDTLHPDLRSTMGNALAEASARAGLARAGAIAYVEKSAEPGTIKVSLRSLEGLDITPYARAFGGGGHAQAASCVVPADAWASWRVVAAAPTPAAEGGAAVAAGVDGGGAAADAPAAKRPREQ